MSVPDGLECISRQLAVLNQRCCGKTSHCPLNALLLSLQPRLQLHAVQHMLKYTIGLDHVQHCCRFSGISPSNIPFEDRPYVHTHMCTGVQQQGLQSV